MLSATGRIAGATTVSVPVAYQGIDHVPAPGSGNAQFAATNVAGAAVMTLPRTGEAPLSPVALATAFVALALLGSRRALRQVAA